MPRFNRKLSQLEAVYQVAPPVVKEESPEKIYNIITESLDSQEYLGNEWFNNLCETNLSSASLYVSSILENNNLLVSKQSILEAIKYYKEYRNGNET